MSEVIIGVVVVKIPDAASAAAATVTAAAIDVLVVSIVDLSLIDDSLPSAVEAEEEVDEGLLLDCEIEVGAFGGSI